MTSPLHTPQQLWRTEFNKQATTATVEAVYKYAHAISRQVEAFTRRRDPMSVDDRVHAAIIATLEGRRTWNPGEIDLARHLISAIKTEITHELRHAKRFPQVSLDDETGGTSGSKNEKTKRVGRMYTRKAMEVWFRVLRTMARDAMVALDLPRDPTLRVSLPEGALDRSEPNALSPQQLIAFLAAMKAECPQHYALVAVLAYTGLRFCHASALRWEDWDRQAAIIKVVRKNFRGEIGPVSRKKQAAKEYPVEPELQDILLEHYEALKLDDERRLKRKGIEVLRHPSAPLENPLMLPTNNGELRTANSLDVAFAKAKKTAGITKRFTVRSAVHVHRPRSSGERRRDRAACTHRARDRGDAAALLHGRARREACGDRRGAAFGAAVRWE